MEKVEFTALAHADYVDSYKSVGMRGYLLTNDPAAIELGALATKSEGNWRERQGYTETTQTVRVSNPEKPGLFLATVKAIDHSEARFSGAKLEVLIGDCPYLSFGHAYAAWAEEMSDEAYAFLAGATRTASRRLKQSLRFATGMAHSYAPHAQRRQAWRYVLRSLGADPTTVERIVKSVRTATCKTALRLGWRPSLPVPAYWEGLPRGIVEIALQSPDTGLPQT